MVGTPAGTVGHPDAIASRRSTWRATSRRSCTARCSTSRRPDRSRRHPMSARRRGKMGLRERGGSRWASTSSHEHDGWRRLVDGHAPASDYADSFTVTGPEGRTAEQWARATFEGAARPGPLGPGARLAGGAGAAAGSSPLTGPRPRLEDHREQPRRDPSRAPLVGDDRTARRARRRQDRVQLTTLVDHERRRSRPLWAVLAPVHRQFVPYLLTRLPRAASADESTPACDRRGLGAARGVELAEDVGDVDRDGLGADEQLLADLAVGAAVGDQREDLGLARGERVGRRPRRAPASLRAPSARRAAAAHRGGARRRGPGRRRSRAPAASPVARRIPAQRRSGPAASS